MSEPTTAERTTPSAQPFKMPANLRAPCDKCGKLRPTTELTVTGIYAYCKDCDPGEPKE